MDEELVQQTTGGRRTRSGRKSSITLSVVPPARSTRRSARSKKDIDDNEQVTEILSESDNHESEVEPEADALETPAEKALIDDIVASEAVEEESLGVEIIEQTETTNVLEELDTIIEQLEPEQVEDEKSSSFPFGDVVPTAQENSSVDQEDIDNSFFANLAADEENANSLPSGTDEVQEEESMETYEPVVVENGEKQDDIVSIIEQQPEEEVVDDQMEVTEEEPAPIINNDDEATTASEDKAVIEDLANGSNSADGTVGDTEMVSEDELPAAMKPEVKDAEEVSDDELPGPKLAELPADTEVVSEDELPTQQKKEPEIESTEVIEAAVVTDEPIVEESTGTKRKVDDGYDPGSPTTESTDIPEKKTKVEEPPPPIDLEEEERKKKLPDLDKYWKTVKDDPTDFTGWTYLLQYVDQENDIEAARDAYDAFLAHYPYCYGYWRKYADYEKRKGDKEKSQEVFEKGLKAIPLSVDLWIHYLAHVKQNVADDEIYIRAQFERAIASCGLEFRSDKLWEAYVKWETDGKRIRNIVGIYDRLLATPTQGYNNHFDSFQELVNNNPVPSLILKEDIKKLRTEVREQLDINDKVITESEDIPPGEEEPDDHLRNELEVTAVKDKILAIRRKIHKATVAAVTDRWTFEEGIKRPYFHVKPLERCQLKNWKEYLDFEIEKGDRKRVLVLFERCLIACALYEEFWLKLVRYLESQKDDTLIDITRDAFDRACNTHHPDKPTLHLMWSAFEELQEDFEKASDILIKIEKICPSLLQIAYRRINLERRRKDYNKCVELYNHYIEQAKSKNVASSLSIKYARFVHKINGDLDDGLRILRKALENDKNNARIVLQLIDLALQRTVVDETEVVNIMDDFVGGEGMDPEQKVLFAQRKVEFLEDFGSTSKGLQDAQRALQVALTKANEIKKKQSESAASKKSSAKDSSVANSTATAANYSSSSYPYQNASNYYYGSRGAGDPAAAGYYSDYAQQQWGYSQYQWGGSGYGSYNY